MKEMIYDTKVKCQLLYTTEYKGFKYYIVNLGTHPCAYVDVTGHKDFENKSYDDLCWLDVHWGLTYSNNYLFTDRNTEIQGWFIGWDYAHCDDYMPSYTGYYLSNGRKWTTREINVECINVINQLVEYEIKQKEMTSNRSK